MNQVVKLLVGRQRPYVFFENDLGYSKSEDNLSFYGGPHLVRVLGRGGHRHRGGRCAATPVWESRPGWGSPWPRAVGYLRIAADQHYLTDVLVGAAIGGLLGWAIPRIFHPPVPGQATGSALRAPAFSLKFAFY